MGHDIRVENVASLSRSAFNPLNQVIYLALGVANQKPNKGITNVLLR